MPVEETVAFSPEYLRQGIVSSSTQTRPRRPDGSLHAGSEETGIGARPELGVTSPLARFIYGFIHSL